MMRRRGLSALTAVCAALAAAGVLAQASDCNRSCLEDALDRYLEAVAANDPDRAGLSAAYRQTENAIAIPVGSGIWESVQGIGAVERRYYDPATGHAVFFGILDEGEASAIAALRLKVSDGAIAEAEWNIGRARDPGIRGEPGEVLFDIDTLTAEPPAARVVPARERLSRDALIAIANSYFDGITAADADVIRAHEGCDRFENGFRVTAGDADCTAGQGSFNVIFVAARRYIVDVEAQVVIASAVFVREPGNDKRRNFFSELFYIDEGLIRDVYAAMYYVPPTRPVPNWPPYAGNFPLPETFGAAR